MAFDLCKITKYKCAYCGSGHCGIGITKKDKKLKKTIHINELELMTYCPLDREEKNGKVQNSNNK